MKKLNTNNSNRYEYDIIVYGMPIYRVEKLPYGGLYGNATRTFGLANNFAKMGFRTALVVQTGFSAQPSPYLCTSLQFVEEDKLPQIAKKSRNLVLTSANFQLFCLFGGNPFIKHPSKFCVCCFDGNDSFNFGKLMDEIYGITFNNVIQKQMWDSRGTQIPAHVVSYGVDEFDYVDDAIEPVENPVAIWIGEIRRRDMLERIVNFAIANPDCRVDIVTRRIFDQNLPAESYGGSKCPYANFAQGDAHQRFYEVVEELLGRKPPSNLRYLGTLEGQNHEVLGTHTIGLDFSRFPAQQHDNTKVLDYLRSGLAVICDDGTPSFRFVDEFQYGYILPCRHTKEDLQRALATCRSLTSYEKRRQTAKQVRERYGWDSTAAQIAEIMRGDEECRHLIIRRRNHYHLPLPIFKLIQQIRRNKYRLSSPAYSLLRKVLRILRRSAIHISG